MTIIRIVADLATRDPDRVARFYEELFGLERLMDQGWIVTSGAEERIPAQISFASEGGSGAPVPALSIEVSDVDEIYGRATALGFPITYELTDEPWGVRRFFVADPDGRAINILSHSRKAAG